MYTINQKTYHLKNKYTLKEWGLILKLLTNIDQNSVTNQLTALLAEDKLTELLNIILDRPVEGDLYEDDIEEVNRIIRDFFSRKNALMKNTNGSLTN